MNQPNICIGCGEVTELPGDVCDRCRQHLVTRESKMPHFDRSSEVENYDGNVVLIRPRVEPEPSEAKLQAQAEFLRDMAEAVSAADDVEQCAFACLFRMKDGTVVVQASGWADDQRAQSYFLTFVRNQGWPA